MTITLNGTTGISNDGGYIGDGIIFADTTPANTLVTTTAGNVGIGTASPAQKLHVNSATGAAVSLVQASAGNTAWFSLLGNGSTFLSNDFNLFHDGSQGSLNMRAALPITFATSGTERMRIASNGTLNVNRTSGGGTVNVKSQTNSFISEFYHYSNDASVGSITTSTTATTYGTSSDYRLKEDIQPMTGALAKVAALKPCTYKWKSSGEQDEGFIAHELQEVCPSAVSGAKDAVDAEGNARYQNIDTSFLVATLTAAIQEQQAIITQLQADVAALKGTSNV